MKSVNRYFQNFREYKSVFFRFLMLILGLLLINFSQAKTDKVCTDPTKVLSLPLSQSDGMIKCDYSEDHVSPPIKNPMTMKSIDKSDITSFEWRF